MERFPPAPLFLSHGAPTLAVEDCRVTRFWKSLPARWGDGIKGVVCVSAHWMTEGPMLAGGHPRPAIQHDFYGFPADLYRLSWPVSGSAELAGEVVSVLEDAGIAVEEDRDWSFDHGVWVPLRTLWPEPAFPILQLSICPRRDPAWHWALGRALAPLAQRGILLVGSGGITHNLGDVEWSAPEDVPAGWAAAFMQAVDAAIEQGESAPLLKPGSLPFGRRAVPTPDHYLPLLVVLGAAGRLQRIYSGWMLGTLALHAYSG